jgi:hypothetical protein
MAGVQLAIIPFYSMHTIYSRISRLNRPDVPTVDQINIFNIPERYHLNTVDNVQQNFILHRDVALNLMYLPQNR